jgi:hypothetical protein
VSSLILFLDFDDVLCLNNPFGGYDVLEALGDVQHGRKALDEFANIWETLFDPMAKAFLEEIHGEFQPHYVLSTSWTRFMNRGALDAVLRQTGLGFVADNLHEDWESEKGTGYLRRDEIRFWLAKHPEVKERWVVVDDTESGTGLHPRQMSESEGQFVVLCDVNVGLTADKYGELRRALLRRGNSERQGLTKRMIHDIAVSLEEAAAGSVVPYEFGPYREGVE